MNYLIFLLFTLFYSAITSVSKIYITNQDLFYKIKKSLKIKLRLFGKIIISYFSNFVNL